MAVLLARLGRFSARHRVLVFVTWALIFVAVAVVALTGMRFSTAGFQVPGTDSDTALSTLDEKFPAAEASGGSLQLVVENPAGAITDDAATLGTRIAALNALPFVTSVSDPFDAARPYVSPDLSTVVIDLAYPKLDSAESEQAAHAVENVAADLRHDGYTAEVGGSLTSEVPEILGPTEIVGAALAFLVLFLTFGSLLMAGANMLVALIGVGVGVLGILASSVITPLGSVTPILAVMLGLAVGIDYGLFILSRFRSELREGRQLDDAIGRAVGTAGSSVVFAGATVIIALVGLTVVGIPFIGEMGLAAAFAVAVAVLISLTLLPALMRSLEHRALGRPPRRTRSTHRSSDGPRWARRWVAAVTRRPRQSGIASIVALVIVALPLPSMVTALSVPGGEDPDSTQRAAYELVADKFGLGAQDPLVVLVQSSRDVNDVTPAAVEELSELPGVDRVIPSGISADSTTALVTVLAKTGPLDPSTIQLIHGIRGTQVEDASLSVTGVTALGLDSDEQLSQALFTYVALIVGLSFILLIILFRSLLVPLFATVGFLLSLGAGLGATIAVFQWGWLGPIVAAPQGNPLLSLLPILVTGILFGLAMDYQVFLVSRIHEAHAHGYSPREAIHAGFKKSAPVVLAAATIMVAVFGGFALSPSSLVGSIALALAVGVFADAFVVRMILMPALLAIFGRAAWWMPRWLDRILPSIDVEGTTLETVPASRNESARLSS